MDLDISKLKITAAAKQKAKNRATEELWRRGKFLDLILDDTQKGMVQDFKDSDSLFYIWMCSRRLGKSVALNGVAIELALTQPGSRILYLSKTTDNVNEIVDQASSVILANCPDALAPAFKKQENKFVFPNGSEIRVKGLDNTGPDVIRGVKAHLTILDEFCFMRNLDYLISSIVQPMAIESHGRILMASTPPDTPGHDSLTWIQKAEERGALTRKTIYDCPRWSDKQIRLFEEEAGGAHTDTFKREYLAEVVISRSKAILPALTDENYERLVEEVKLPYYIPDCYVSLDIGFRDLTVALFGYWDYEKAILKIQDEIVLRGNEATTDNIARKIVNKETELWSHVSPHKRVCDTDPRLIADLKKLSNLHFRPTKKDNKEAQVNQVNIMIERGQIQIDPRCKTLLLHMRYGIWNDARTGFSRTKALGHCDAIDALLYMARNIDRGNNPMPETKLHYTQVYHGSKPEHITSHGVGSMRAAFRRR